MQLNKMQKKLKINKIMQTDKVWMRSREDWKKWEKLKLYNAKGPSNSENYR